MQGRFQHGRRLPAGLRPRRAQDADRRVGLPSEETSTPAPLRQSHRGLADVPVTLLPLPERQQEQVHVRYRQKVSEYLLDAYFLPRVK